ncbi:putative oxidoreductase CzcO [Roseovarius albus]|uniref:Putative oxidoreductase CzcO n=1 Tax=Roseovarius albus TaxID=1247867 RepID=A0A1X7A144_9RHOB|nr:NAD(P)-binding domain-containing protein [Roseovarius albus]SLN65595.1 putative oxidoreductase CzcO [Roseovarius albus]
MKHVNTIIIGAGQSGLAMSAQLITRGIDHVILERGQIANSWRSERWDSLYLLSPNWMNGLAGKAYDGPNCDGFMHVSELVFRFDQTAAAMSAPIQTETTVLSVNTSPTGYVVQTDQGAMTCTNVVMANGACARSNVPGFATNLPQTMHQFTPQNYKRPDDLPDGKVLVIGASASGQQLAREIQASGRQTTLAVGTHLRFPRTYRGKDIMMWLDVIGATSVSHTEVDDIARVRRTPSLTLVADDTIDLNTLQNEGVEITGRLAAVQDGTALFSGSLSNLCEVADLKMNRLLTSVDEWIEDNGLGTLVPASERFEATRVPTAPKLKLDLAREGFKAVLWATGYEPDFHWLNLPVFDRKGRLIHDGGVVSDGLYAMGLPYMRQRQSTFLNGAQSDAAALAAHLGARIGQPLAA